MVQASTGIRWIGHLLVQKSYFSTACSSTKDKEVINFEHIANYVAKEFNVAASIVRVPAYQEIVNKLSQQI